MPTIHPVEKHEQIMTDLRKDVDDHEIRVRALEEGATQRKEQIAALYETVGAIKQMISDIRADIEKIKEKPAKQWNSLVGYIISGFVMLIIAYIGKVIFP